MAKGVNKVILLGNLGNDPELRAFQNGGHVTHISLATSETWTDKRSGQKQEKTEWHKVVFFNRLAELIAQYTRKGSKVFIEGQLRTKKHTDQQGIERYITEIIANQVQFLDSQQHSPTYQPPASPHAVQAARQAVNNKVQNAYKNAQSGANVAPMPQPPTQKLSDDEIPF